MENEKKSKKKIIVPIVIVAAVLVVIIVGAVIIASIAKKASSMMGGIGGTELVPVEKRDLSDSISFKGTLSGASRNNVSSKAAAEVTSVNVQVGDVVKVGDLLCELDSKELEEQLQKANINVTNSQAIANNQTKQNKQALVDAKEDQVASLKAITDSINEAKEEYNQAKKAYDEANAKLQPAKDELAKAAEAVKIAEDAYNALPEDASLEEIKAAEASVKAADKVYELKEAAVDAIASEIAEYKATMDGADKAIKTGEAEYNATKKSTDRAIENYQNVIDMEKYQLDDSTLSDAVKNLLEQYEDCKVYAPISGVVTAVNVSVGDNNTPGVTMITIEDNEHMKLVVNVEEQDILKLEEGMEAEITSDVLEDVTLKGEISRVVRVKNQSMNPEDLTSGAAGYMAEISVEKSDLLIGMTARARVSLRSKKDVLCVPYDLVKEDEDGQKYILIAEDKNGNQKTAKRVDITTGEEFDYYVEVTGGELKEGDLVIMDASMEEGAEFTASEDYFMNIEEE